MLYKKYFNKMYTNKNRLIIKVLPILLNVIYTLLLFEKIISKLNQFFIKFIRLWYNVVFEKNN